jgi:hypothetical protein
MKIAYFPNQMALNSEHVWKSFLTGCKNCNLTPVENTLDADAVVIWSVLWWGRLLKNYEIYQHFKRQGKPVFVIEVGGLMRGKTWKVAVDNITNEGIYANTDNFIRDRDKKLEIRLEKYNDSRRHEILIAGQHEKSLQWHNMPSISDWYRDTVNEIKKYTDRPIFLRPHPRSPAGNILIPGTILDVPKKLPDTYGIFNMNYNYHCVINWNSSVSTQAAINGCPVITGNTSLAYPVSNKLENLENISLLDREQWFTEIMHTEWLVEELAAGIPQKRILDKIL